MDALRTVPGHNDVIIVRELRQIVTGLKNNKAVGNDGIPSEVYKFASERRLTMMSIFLSGCMLTANRTRIYARSASYHYARSAHTAIEMQIGRSSRC